MTDNSSVDRLGRCRIADVSRWAHRNDWRSADWRGYQNATFEDQATIAVRTNEAGFQVWRKPADVPHFTGQPTDYPADSVRQAVDILVALGILPASFSSAYEAGRDDTRSDDWDDYCDYGYPLGGHRPCVEWCGLKRGHAGLHYGGHDNVGFTNVGTVRRGVTR